MKKFKAYCVYTLWHLFLLAVILLFSGDYKYLGKFSTWQFVTLTIFIKFVYMFISYSSSKSKVEIQKMLDSNKKTNNDEIFKKSKFWVIFLPISIILNIAFNFIASPLVRVSLLSSIVVQILRHFGITNLFISRLEFPNSLIISVILYIIFECLVIVIDKVFWKYNKESENSINESVTSENSSE